MNRETPAVNKTWAELKPGDVATLRRLCVADDFIVFAHASGNRNPIHLSGKHGAPAPAMWVGALISSVLGNVLPGPGTIYHDQTLHWHAPAKDGDELVIGVREAKRAGQGYGTRALILSLELPFDFVGHVPVGALIPLSLSLDLWNPGIGA